MKTYLINEIFYSLQGEGHWAGRPAVFIRFSGCNLRCPFCDTDHTAHTAMTADQLMAHVLDVAGDCRFAVITGGEPTLQTDEALIDAFHNHHFMVAIETNGTRPYPANIDWVTFSPKDLFVDNAAPVIRRANETKIVFDCQHDIPDYAVESDYYYLQPCDTGCKEQNQAIMHQLIDYLKGHPKWMLSLQQHKIINIR